jgi:signal peptidase I
VAKADEGVISVSAARSLPFVTKTEIRTTANTYSLPVPADVAQRQLGIRPGRSYSKGEPIAVGFVDTGDQVFVDKVSYHFIPPQRGEVFVFKTNSIAGIPIDRGMGAQHYIKRLVGLPGDELRVEPPRLFVNGKLGEEKTIQRVMSEKDGYRGYSNGGYDQNNRYGASALLPAPSSTFQVPLNGFFAMGDNSFNSYDSRGWGHVPERNLVGRGVLVWWPFNSHWGVIH